ncbi:MAG: hypothetical protein EA417_18645 [Gammaproteobacteria bacterium]|nr:MAG: hypothetical protein EA417_18645 [Gammaproteobacteria bacterium]
MPCDIPSPEALSRVCADLEPISGMAALTEAVNGLAPAQPFRWVLTRGGWHRLGGVVDPDHRRVSDNITHWLDAACAGDMESLLADYGDAGYLATRMAGKTHFFTAACGERPEDFIQIEIEELQELIERPLIDPEWLPDSIEDLLEPLEMRNAQMWPIGRSFYQFRRTTLVPELLEEGPVDGPHLRVLRRFMNDWRNSSAAGHANLCEHWVLALREYKDQDGTCRVMARPLAVGRERFPDLPVNPDLRGAKLATELHAYDRAVGYPFAWYFTMLSRKGDSYALADAVLADLMGAYDYLPRKDLQILHDWERHPYAV